MFPVQAAIMTILHTKRLILRPWKDSDLPLFAALNADPRVMEYFPAILSRQESNALASKICEAFGRQGWGFWAVEVPHVAEFIGFIGLAKPSFEAHFMPAVEVGWRLAFEHWGKGYATEGAKAALAYGFDALKLNEIVSFTPTQNTRSRSVMEKLGMQHDPKDDFNHPKLPEGHSLQRFVLYRISAQHIQG